MRTLAIFAVVLLAGCSTPSATLPAEPGAVSLKFDASSFDTFTVSDARNVTIALDSNATVNLFVAAREYAYDGSFDSQQYGDVQRVRDTIFMRPGTYETTVRCRALTGCTVRLLVE